MRIKSLDSLRGIAALVVVFHHCVMCLPHNLSWVGMSPLRLLVDGQGAVLVFFALSGFVLFKTFNEKDHFQYLPYAVKRITRIYLPFAFGILFAALLWLIINPHLVPALSIWYNKESWSLYPSTQLVFEHLFLTDRTQFQSLDNVMWSLVHEMRISMIFPILALAVVWDWRIAVIGAFLLSLVNAVIYERLKLDWVFNPFFTLRYVFLFVAGAVLCLKAQPINLIVQHAPGWALAVVWIISLALITLPTVAFGTMASIAAILLVALCFSDSRVSKILSTPVPIWLGRVSYSLYLIHLPILLALTHLLVGVLPLYAIFALTILTSLCLAEVCYRLIEMPSMTLGRIVAKRLSPRKVALTTA